MNEAQEHGNVMDYKNSTIAKLGNKVQRLEQELVYCQRLLGQAMTQISKHNGVYYFNKDFKPDPADEVVDYRTKAFNTLIQKNILPRLLKHHNVTESQWWEYVTFRCDSFWLAVDNKGWQVIWTELCVADQAGSLFDELAWRIKNKEHPKVVGPMGGQENRTEPNLDDVEEGD